MALAFIFAALGVALGAMLGGMLGALAGAVAGGAIGAWLAKAGRRRVEPGVPATPQYGVPAASRTAETAAISSAVAGAAQDAADARLSAIERRLAEIEARLGIEAPARVISVADVEAPAASDETEATATQAGGAAPAITDESPVRQPDGTMAAARAEPPREAAAIPAYSRLDAAPARHPNPLWAWFTGGNTLTRIGVIVLFFGVAFLLRWFAEHFTVPIELRLAGVAAGGVAMLVLGLALAPRRAAYGLALQGAGAGVLYLTAFAAFRLYEVLPPGVALALLVAIAGATVALALRADSQPMAALAFAGGFLAPVLVSRGGGEPVPLFGYLALLNGALFAIAWRRSWRALNAIGFVFTFALALVWGWQYYAPRHFAAVEPFLALFFAFYVAIAILEASRSELRATAPVDALLVFGVPAAAFALQHGLVREFRYGEAWSALALALVYAALAYALRGRRQPGLQLLARAFTALAVVFATLAIPFALDARHTAAWWALEAAGAYWLGVRQRQFAVRASALMLQVGAAAFLIWAGPWPGTRTPFANAGFIGAALIAVSALSSAFFADREPDALRRGERALVPWVFAWGSAWWIGAGGVELLERLYPDVEAHAVLAWVAGSAVAALGLQRLLDWPRIARLGVALLPVMAIVAAEDLDRQRTTLLAYGTLVWPFAWLAHWATLAGVARPAEPEPQAPTDAGGPLAWLHAVSAVLLVAHLSWEAGEWAGRWTPEGTSWITAASAVPAIVFLVAVAWMRGAPPGILARYRDAYAVNAGTVVAALLAAWFLLANAISPGDPDPLPYVPLANPLDVALAMALAAAWQWSARCATMDERTRYVALGAALFVALNGLVVRTVHHWLDVPWRVTELASSKPLQAALTLAWTATALPLMFAATRRHVRPLWMVGAALLALVVVKLFALDLAALSGLPRVVAFLGVGALLLVIGYVAPLPPAPADGSRR